MEINNEELEGLYKQLNDSKSGIVWLNQNGINSYNRINSYQKKLENYIKIIEVGQLNKLKGTDEYREYSNSFFDLTEFIEITQGLMKIQVNDELIKRVGRYIEGPINIDEENPSKNSNQPRDIGFELIIGSRLIRGGYDIIFNDEGDLEYKTNNGNFYIECKRPSSVKQIVRNIEKAHSQLKSRYESDEKGRGIIAFSIGKLINSLHSTIVVNDVLTRKNILQQQTTEWIQQNIKEFDRFNKDNRTIGFIVLLQVPIHTLSNNNLSMDTFMGIVSFGEQDSYNFNIFKNMYDRMLSILN